jgi:hypothetical protein
MSHLQQYRKKPITVTAARYGKDDDGRWYPGAVQRIAQFMLGEQPDAQISEARTLDVVQPTAVWDPPHEADLLIWDGIAHGKWLPLAPGDYVIRGVSGEFYPCKPDIFADTYEAVYAAGSAPEVRPGQVWADNDPRSAGRTIRIDAIERSDTPYAEDCAVVTTLTPARNVGRVGHQTRIAIRRFRPTSTGYRLITDTPTEETR